ncbi:ROK family protein [Pedobacter nutrimenti]|uniref:Polyphosphate glucokinase n=1 Tax=Pedobacter nutrimenti TaxID=1241337 RepID=A0A318UK25_9SPHI|nr:ROK family protein [Pedobacter nutrimenti]PYF76714.1 polyphosphate glucokinase [Pedobacter nutrimenti]|eukprot:gene10099-11775_t
MPNNEDKETKDILSVDIGGSNIKACLLSPQGDMLSEYTKLPTPAKASPEAVLVVIKQLAATMGPFGKISVGFPGYTRSGVVYTAPNLAKDKWDKIDFAQQISNALNKPVRLINDADQQGLGLVAGKGFEIVLTFGTGLGTALLFDGELLPHLELSHLPVSKTKDYDDYVGDRAIKKHGVKEWNERVLRVIDIYKTVFNYDTLYLGGGNAKELDIELEQNIKIVSNKEGIKGGAKLWKAAEKYHIKTLYPAKK